MLIALVLSQVACAAPCTGGFALYYRDGDRDGYGNAAISRTRCKSADNTGWSLAAGDCNDASAAVYPGAEERCDALDNDCDGTVDPPTATDAATWFRDADGDGHGTEEDTTDACAAPEGYVATADDCDDTSNLALPGGTEVCDELDNDCDGEIDPPTSTDAELWYRDEDGDGYGVDTETMTACAPAEGWVGTPGDCDDEDPTRHQHCGWLSEYTVVYGDPHNHSGLSYDACEDPANLCRPRGTLPAADTFAHGLAMGLDFQGITDHMEYDRYRRPEAAVDLMIWTQAQATVQAAEGSGLLPLLGYEYKGPSVHRTILFDRSSVCTDLVKSGSASSTSKGRKGIELYRAATSSGYTTDAEFIAGMTAAEAVEACAGTRWISYLHHPAYTTPAVVDWGNTDFQNSHDRVVEIASSHGSSECFDTAKEGCDFQRNTARYSASGSVQRALQLGYKLGFVGGTDNHEGRPELVEESVPGTVASFEDADGDGEVDDPRHQFGQGALTGVYIHDELDRTALFDAIEARHTFATTWRFEGLRVHVVDESGAVYLPGDDVPAVPLTVAVSLSDPEVEEYWVEVVDPFTGDADTATTFTVPASGIRYLRLRAWVGGVEERAWFSPFFAK